MFSFLIFPLLYFQNIGFKFVKQSQQIHYTFE